MEVADVKAVLAKASAIWAFEFLSHFFIVGLGTD